MLKRLCIASVLAISLCLVACGNKENTEGVAEAQKVSGVGDTASDDRFSITLKKAEFTDTIKYPLYNPGNAGKNFFVPTTRDNLIQGQDNALLTNESDDKVWLYYDLEFEYIGKESYGLTDLAFTPVVSYQDYVFDTIYLSFLRINEDSWSNLNTDLSQSEISAIGLSLGYLTTLKLEPLTSDSYMIRGAIKVSKTVADDIDNDVTIRLSGVEFSVR